MHSKFRLFSRIAAIIIIGFFAYVAFNKICAISHKCQPFYFSSLIPKKPGDVDIQLNFKITNRHKNITIYALQPSATLSSNQVNKTEFILQNNSKRRIKLKPIFKVAPAELKPFIVRYECLCSKSVILEPGEEVKLQSVLLVDKKIDDYENADAFFDSEKEVLNIDIKYIF